MKFVDLFCGIGGFHQALKNHGECVFAAEIDAAAAKIYEANHGIKPVGDIKKIDEKDIPDFDLLCAGFPCQPFSHAGNKQGFDDKVRGNLFFDILRILNHKKPKYFILENVKNLLTHDNGHTFKFIIKSLKESGYNVDYKIHNPMDIGIPHNRPRVFIVGRYDKGINLKIKKVNKLQPLVNFLDTVVDLKYDVSQHKKDVISIYKKFIKSINKKDITFSLWLDYFKFNGDLTKFPKWKQEIITKNVKFYTSHKTICNKLLLDLKDTIPTYRKLEWQAGNIKFDESLLQFRQSGLRFKTNKYIPCLVAIVQLPILCNKLRTVTPRECARLQSFPDDFIIHSNDKLAYKQLGNSVNVKLIESIYLYTFVNNTDSILDKYFTIPN